MGLLDKWIALWCAHWKTSVQGILSFLSVTATAVAGWLVLQIVLDPAWKGKTSYVYVAGASSLVAALCKAWLGLFQKDAGTVPATLPGVPGVQQVPAHEIPDDPAAKPVIKS
jgi:hypothetical protein